MADELSRHLEVLARWAVRWAFESWADDAWEGHFPEVGQYDFERIIDHAKALLPPDVTIQEFGESYAFFEARANAEPDGETSEERP